MVLRLWNSPTFMTWGSLLAKSSGLIVLLPLVLRKLEPEDTVLWFLFFNIFAFQMLFDLGLSSSFIRILSYGVAGTKIENLAKVKDIKTGGTQDTNWNTIFAINVIMMQIYKKIAFFSFFFGLFVGSILLYKPINMSTNPLESWLSWLVVLLSSFIGLYFSYYSSFLQGLNKIALVQRWSMLSSLLSIISASTILFFNGTLLEAICAYQFWMIANIFILQYFRKKIVTYSKNSYKYSSYQLSNIWNVVWSSAWRSGVGVFMSAGIIQLSGLIYSNLVSANESVQYLFALQLIRAISNFSQAPFYSKIPYFSMLYATGKIEELKKISKEAMQKSYIVFIFGFAIFGLFGNTILEIINTKSQFPDIKLWIILSLGILMERYGAMHIQLYSITNHIVWHIANGYTGIAMIILTIILFPIFGIMAFALSILIAYLLIYAPYSAKFSYREFQTSFFHFEKFVFIPTIIIFLLFSVLIFILNKGSL